MLLFVAENHDAVPVVDVVGLNVGAFGRYAETVGIDAVLVDEG